MSAHEWESLCDGCGRCCLLKLEDEDSGALVYSHIACRLLDLHSCRCSAYGARTRLVSDCIDLRGAPPEAFSWLPDTCAYRRLAEGGELEWWHPLVSGDANTVHRAGISVRGRVLSERHVHPSELECLLAECTKDRSG